MKSKLVIWGQQNDQKVLLAIALRANDNKIDTYVFPESMVTEEFSNKMSTDWKNDIAVDFPEGYTQYETELNSSGEILPEGIKVEGTDTISRAQIEWQFFVLSAKLATSYEAELETIKDKIAQLKEFSQPLWDDLKSFWDKVQNQIREKNILGNHITDLRKSTNEAFESLKEKRKELDQKFNENSSSIKANFMNALQDINDKISKGMSLHPIFEELKNLQNDFKKATMTLSDKRNVWDKLDAAFKVVKEKRFGSKEGKSSDQNNVKDRLNNRYNGLLTAISKMEQSIDFDKKDIDFQTKKMDGQVGQLELQIRQAKLKMIEERIQSKQAKLADMVATKLELEQRKEKIEKSEAARAEKEEAKKVIQDKIAAEIKAASDSRTDNADDLEKAAQKIAESKQRKEKPKDDSILDTLQSNISETVEDVVDTVKAVSSVIGDKIGDLVDDITAKAADILEGQTDEDNTSVASEEQQESVSENPIAEDLGNTENTDIKEETSENKEDEEEKA